MDIPFVLLHLTTALTFTLFALILRFRNKKALHYYFIFTFLAVFLWCLLFLIQQYMMPIDQSATLFFNICFNSLILCLSILLFFIGYIYSKTGTKINPRMYLLFLYPIVFITLYLTSGYHDLVYVEYSAEKGEFVRGSLAYVGTFINYGFIILGLSYLVRFTIKNSGFFSKQSVLIFLGALAPIVVDVTYMINNNIFPRYFEAISFTVTVICFLIAIFRFELFNIVPVALQTVVDHISDSYLVFNDQLELSDFNKTFVDTFDGVFLLKRKEKIQKILDENAEYYDIIRGKLYSSIDEQRQNSFEIHIQKESFDRYFIVEITPVMSAGAIICTIMLFKDITEQKRDAELIAKTQYMLIESEHLASLGQLVGGIAHNLKTPIMSVAGGLEGMFDLIDEYDESIEDSAVTAADHHEIAEEMRGWIRKMKEYTAYMSDIITAVKGQAVQLTASTTGSFSVRELIKRVEILMNHELKRYSCRLDVKCSVDENTIVKGELNSFIQVINNLIINGIEAYEGQRGVIEFLISRQEEMILFEIKDHGSGMTDDVKEKLFKEMITTKAKNGTGLGLYMSYSTITGRFGGKMWFESERGTGSTFHILIPSL